MLKNSEKCDIKYNREAIDSMEEKMKQKTLKRVIDMENELQLKLKELEGMLWTIKS